MKDKGERKTVKRTTWRTSYVTHGRHKGEKGDKKRNILPPCYSEECVIKIR